MKRKFDDLKKTAEAKKPKLISSIQPRDYASLCTAAVSNFQQCKEEYDALCKDGKFDEDSRQLILKLREILAAKAKIEEKTILRESTDDVVVEIEALYKSFLSFKASATKSLQAAKAA